MYGYYYTTRLFTCQRKIKKFFVNIKNFSIHKIYKFKIQFLIIIIKIIIENYCTLINKIRICKFCFEK